MGLHVTEIRDDRGYSNRDSLFDDIRHFRFTPRRGGFMRTRSLQLGDIRVAEVSSAGHDIAIGGVGGQSFIAPQSGRIRVETARLQADARAGGALFVGPGDRETHVRADEARAFRALVAIAPGARRAAPASAFGMPANHTAAGNLGDFLRYVIDTVAQPGNVLTRPAALAAAEALIRDGMAALDDLFIPSLVSDAADAAARHVRAAEEYIRAHAEAPLTVEAIASAAGIGVRSLHLAFRRHRETTPRALLEEVRMELARARLLAPSEGMTVTDAALESGFVHLGRFAVAYRHRFGESPSETLRLAR
jgi:AraC-like DNA-binding protein